MNNVQPTSPTSDRTFDRPLRCVSSGYLSDGCSCQAAVPTSVVAAAWKQALQRSGAREDRFFTFPWNGGQWLGYGLRDGGVRGVYCPEHNARRTQHSSTHRERVAA
jgi:hypothetical protein